MIDSSHELFEALKALGVFAEEDEESVTAFTIFASVGKPARMLVERRVDARVGDAVAATLIQFDAREVPAD